MTDRDIKYLMNLCEELAGKVKDLYSFYYTHFGESEEIENLLDSFDAFKYWQERKDEPTMTLGEFKEWIEKSGTTAKL